MEAANRGAREAGGKTIGLNIRLPFEQGANPYITEGLHFEFHYFFMRKFWFAYLAKALVMFPGGFGTLDELFEILTLVQTDKLSKKIGVILYGREYWEQVLDLKPMAEWGAIAEKDLELLHYADTPIDAFEQLRDHLIAHHLEPATEQESGGAGHREDAGLGAEGLGARELGIRDWERMDAGKAQRADRSVQRRLPRRRRGAGRRERRGARRAAGAGQVVGARGGASSRRQRDDGGDPAAAARRHRQPADLRLRPGRVRRRLYYDRPIEASLDAFKAARRYDQRDPRAADRGGLGAGAGTHTEHGRYTVERWLEIYAGPRPRGTPSRFWSRATPRDRGGDEAGIGNRVIG